MLVCKPIIPFLQDVYAHAFNEVDHLAKVHHQNGMNHVNKEIGNITKEDNVGDNASKSKFSDEVAFHFLVESQLAFNCTSKYTKQVYFDNPKMLCSISSAIQLPPPKL